MTDTIKNENQSRAGLEPDQQHNLEEWKDISGYEGMYQVSNLGKVRGLDRTITMKNGFKRVIKGRELTPIINKAGYTPA